MPDEKDCHCPVCQLMQYATDCDFCAAALSALFNTAATENEKRAEGEPLRIMVPAEVAETFLKGLDTSIHALGALRSLLLGRQDQLMSERAYGPPRNVPLIFRRH